MSHPESKIYIYHGSGLIDEKSGLVVGRLQKIHPEFERTTVEPNEELAIFKSTTVYILPEWSQQEGSTMHVTKRERREGKVDDYKTIFSIPFPNEYSSSSTEDVEHLLTTIEKTLNIAPVTVISL